MSAYDELPTIESPSAGRSPYDTLPDSQERLAATRDKQLALGQGLGIAEQVVEPYTIHGMLSQPARIARAMGLYHGPDPATDKGLLSPEWFRFTDPIEAMAKGGRAVAGAVGLPTPPVVESKPGPFMQGVQQQIPETLSQFTAPETVALAPAFVESKVAPILNNIIRAIIGGEMAIQVPGELQKTLGPGVPPEERGKAAVRGVADTALAYLMTKTGGSPEPTGARPVENPSGAAAQIPMQGQHPTQDYPLPKNLVGRYGDVLPLSQLSPEEQNALEQRERFKPRETYVKQAEASPVVVGQQPPNEPIYVPPDIIQSIADRIRKQQIVPRPEKEVQGGQVSFAAPAEAGAIPSARQAGLPGAVGGAEQPPGVIAQVGDIVANKDRQALVEMRRQVAAQPSLGVARSTPADLLRLIDNRLAELERGITDPELQRLRDTTGLQEKLPPRAPAAPIPTEVTVHGPVKGELVGGGRAEQPEQAPPPTPEAPKAAVPIGEALGLAGSHANAGNFEKAQDWLQEAQQRVSGMAEGPQKAAAQRAIQETLKDITAKRGTFARDVEMHKTLRGLLDKLPVGDPRIKTVMSQMSDIEKRYGSRVPKMPKEARPYGEQRNPPTRSELTQEAIEKQRQEKFQSGVDPEDLKKLRPTHQAIPGYIGAVTPYNTVDATKIGDITQLTHQEAGVWGRNRWRYDSKENKVYWNEYPSQEEKVAMDDWLAKQGISNAKHVGFEETTRFLSRYYSGMDPEDLAKRLLPAVRIAGKLVAATPDQAVHADIIKAHGLDPESSQYSHYSANRLFVDPQTGQEYTRAEAAKATGIKGSADAGGLDSTDLPRITEARMYQLEHGKTMQVKPGAAITFADGRTFTGQTHFMAYLAAEEEGYANQKPVKAGFITKEGKYVEEPEKTDMYRKMDREGFGRVTETEGELNKALDKVEQQIKELTGDDHFEAARKYSEPHWGRPGYPKDLDEKVGPLLQEHMDIEGKLQSLYEYGEYKEERTQDAIRELRPDSISETQPPRDIQAMGEEVRPGAEAAREAQKEEAHVVAASMGEVNDYYKNQGIDPAALFGKDWDEGYYVKRNGEFLRVDKAEMNPTAAKSALAAGLWKYGAVGDRPLPGERLFSGIPLFDPEMWGGTKEARDGLEKYAAFVARQRGDPDGAAKLKEAAQATRFKKANASPEVREIALTSNKDARNLSKARSPVAQPGERVSGLDELRAVWKRVGTSVRSVDLSLNPMDVLFDWLDAGHGRYNGPLMEYIRKPLDDAFNLSEVLNQQAMEPIREAVRKNKLDDRNASRIGAYLISRMEGGAQKLADSGIEAGKVPKELTPQEMEIVRHWEKTIADLLPQIERVAKDVDGVKLKLAKNFFPLAREWGRYKPSPDELATSQKLMTQLAKKSGVDVEDLLWPGLPRERLGAAKPMLERAVEGPVRIDAFALMDRFVRDATHYIASRKLLKETSQIVRKQEFAERYGDLGQQFVMEYLNNFARQGRYQKNLILDWMRRQTSRGIIGFRIPSQIVHMANVPLAIQRVGAAWWGKGMEVATDGSAEAFMRQHFAETYARGGGEPSLAELSKDYARSPRQQMYKNINDWAFATQRFIDQKNSQATVMAYYMRELARKGQDPNDYATLPVDQDAIRQARVLARRAVASPIYKDVPRALSQGGSLGRSFMQFQNTFLDQWSNIRYDLPEYLRNDPKQALTLATALTAMLMLETTVKYGYKTALTKATGGEMKEDDTFERHLFREAMRRIPGGGQLVSAILYKETGIPSFDVFYQPGREIVSAIQTKEPSQRRLAATRATAAIGEIAGIPGVSQASDIVQASQRAKEFKSHERRMQDVTGKPSASLSLEERATAEGQVKEARPPMDRYARAKAAERATLNEAKRGEAVQDSLEKDTRKWLKANDLEVPGYADAIPFGGKRIVLTKEEGRLLSEYVQQEYESAIADIRKDPDWEQAGMEVKKTWFNNAMRVAKNKATNRIRENMSRSENERDKPKKKRFSVFAP